MRCLESLQQSVVSVSNLVNAVYLTGKYVLVQKSTTAADPCDWLLVLLNDTRVCVVVRICQVNQTTFLWHPLNFRRSHKLQFNQSGWGQSVSKEMMRSWWWKIFKNNCWKKLLKNFWLWACVTVSCELWAVRSGQERRPYRKSYTEGLKKERKRLKTSLTSSEQCWVGLFKQLEEAEQFQILAKKSERNSEVVVTETWSCLLQVELRIRSLQE